MCEAPCGYSERTIQICTLERATALLVLTRRYINAHEVGAAELAAALMDFFAPGHLSRSASAASAYFASELLVAEDKADSDSSCEARCTLVCPSRISYTRDVRDLQIFRTRCGHARTPPRVIVARARPARRTHVLPSKCSCCQLPSEC